VSQQINLFNPIFKQQKKHFSAMTMAQALGVIVVGALLLGGFTIFKTKRLEAQANAVSLQAASAERQMAAVVAEFAPRQQSAALAADMQKTESELKALQKVEDVLKKGDFGNTKGYAEYLRAFARQIIDGVWLTGFSIIGAGNEISIQGRALQPELIPAYIGRLRSEAVMQGKSFAALEISTPEPVATKTDVKGKPVIAAPSFVEFNLQSVGAPSKAADGSGAKSK
jgi:hypothetical protein